MMSTHPVFNPDVLDPTCMGTLREAVRLAAEAKSAASEQERRHLASIILSFYRRGLIDPIRLAEIAELAASSRAFRSQYSTYLYDQHSADQVRTS